MATFGVPEITPVDVLRDRPDGRLGVTEYTSSGCMSDELLPKGSVVPGQTKTAIGALAVKLIVVEKPKRMMITCTCQTKHCKMHDSSISDLN